MDGNQDNFYEQHKQKIDISGIKLEKQQVPNWFCDEYVFPSLNDGYYSRVLDYPLISKLLSKLEIKPSEYSNDLIIHNIKNWYQILDIDFCVNSGHNKLEYLDMTPGDTSINYRIYYEPD